MRTPTLLDLEERQVDTLDKFPLGTKMQRLVQMYISIFMSFVCFDADKKTKNVI